MYYPNLPVKNKKRNKSRDKWVQRLIKNSSFPVNFPQNFLFLSNYQLTFNIDNE